MDFSKYPLEKVFDLVAGVIPGVAAMLVYAAAAPGVLGWFFSLGFLGYKTKLAFLALAAFVVGSTLTTIVGVMLAVMVQVVLALRPVKLSYQYDAAPWRDPLWRSLVRDHIGAKAPKDTDLMSQASYQHQLNAPDSLPVEQKITRNHELLTEMLGVQKDDQDWERWYNHFHEIVLKPDDKDFSLHIRNGLRINLETTALYVLVGALFVPHLRRWWCILPASIWGLVFLAEVFWEYKKKTDRWTTLSAQVKYLSDLRQETPRTDPN